MSMRALPLLLPFLFSSCRTAGGEQDRPDSVHGGDATADTGAEASFPDAATDDTGTARDRSACDAGAPRLRVVTLNTHSFQEGPSSIEKLGQIGRGLATVEPDLVALNEVMSGTFHAYDYGGAEYDGTEIIRTALEDASGIQWHARTYGFAHWDTGELMSNVILSRTPLVDADARALTTTDFWPGPGEARSVGYAFTTVPAIGPVHFFVTHTWGWDSADTLIQIDEAHAFVASKLQTAPGAVVVAGDMNVASGSAAHMRWLAGPLALRDAAQVDAALVAQPTARGDRPARIDYIFVGGAPSPLESCAARLLFTGREGELPSVSDHVGVLVDLVR